MSMPGFKYVICCEACGAESDSYPLLVFHESIRGSAWFPAWSAKNRCYAHVRLFLRWERRQEIEATPGALVALAAALSTPELTVGVPDGLTQTTLTPPAVCPFCGGPAVARSALDGPSQERG